MTSPGGSNAGEQVQSEAVLVAITLKPPGARAQYRFSRFFMVNNKSLDFSQGFNYIFNLFPHL